MQTAITTNATIDTLQNTHAYAYQDFENTVHYLLNTSTLQDVDLSQLVCTGAAAGGVEGIVAALICNRKAANITLRLNHIEVRITLSSFLPSSPPPPLATAALQTTPHQLQQRVSFATF
jgi:hypothetical protein